MRQTRSLSTRFLALAALAALAAAPVARADDPSLVLVHTGRLLDASDQPVSNPALPLTFRIFQVSAPNDTETPLWSGDYTVNVVAGFYEASLGSGASKLPVSVFATTDDRYLEVVVDGVALRPRMRIGTVPNAANALNLGGVPAANYALKADVYTRADIDGLFSQQASAISTATDTKLALKADAATTYSKTQVDAALAGKADAATTYTKTQVDAALAPKADSASLSDVVRTSQTYSDPSWITGLSISKLIGQLPFAGDLSGNSGAATVGKLQGFPVANTQPTKRQELMWNGSSWAPTSPRAPVALTDGANIAVDGSVGTVFDLTLTGNNHTIALPSNQQNGELYVFRIHQDAAGGHQITWASGYLFSGINTGVSTAANSQSIVTFVSDGTNLFATGSYNLGSLSTSTGGSIANVGGYRIHTFLSSGTFIPGGNGNVEVLVVGGGGSGGNNNTTNANGGGGGGGVIYQASYAVTGGSPIVVTVGNGGAAVGSQVAAQGNDGQPSAFGPLIALGGGGGGSSGAGVGRPGGSGGGGAYYNAAGGAATQSAGGMGHNGGVGNYTWTGGGGGGAGSNGMDGSPGNGTAGNGGTGYQSSISGSVAYYGGGGGGGGNTSEHAGDGYDGGGRGYGTTASYGYSTYPVGVNAATHGSTTPTAIPNTGGGGGAGSYWACNGSWCSGSGAGGSGIVIVRYIP